MMQTSILQKRLYHINTVDETDYSKIVYERKDKLDKMVLLLNEGCSENAALEAINIPRSTFYRWKRNYRLFGLVGLENESKRPTNIRKPNWSKETELQVYHLRKKFPLWGKQKLAIMYQRKYNVKISQSMIGRILSKLLKRRKITSARVLLYGKRDSKKRIFNNYAQRWKHGMKAKKAGELIQVDHMTVHIPGFGYVKHFSATCPITKYAAYQVYQEATSKNAADFLEHIQQEFPFSIQSIQVDGGSEFMAYFENACKKANIPLFVLPPRCPELNGNVERSNGTAKYEFYAQYNAFPNLYTIRQKLQKFGLFYNFERPHQGIGLLTPDQFYSEINIRP
jgi:transposase InsO family protein